MSQSMPVEPASSVRTPEMVPCPICGTPLTATQTVCSPKCRTKRARNRHEAQRRERDAMVRLHLRTAIEAATEALAMLREKGA